MACYLRLNPSSRLFSGKALILGGSFANELNPSEVPPGVRVGDLSATLIDKAPWIAAHMRTPSRELALMADWEQKLPLMVSTVAREPVTSLSGVPSWFLILLRRVMAEKGVENLHEVWPGLEVFFHGGISFAPYRAEYESFTVSSRMHFLETYNASEGFFAVQRDPQDPCMTLLLDRGVYFEFSPMQPDGSWGAPLPLSAIEPGHTYSLIISAPNGLWRYAIGDTVKFDAVAPPRFRIAGRTKSFINAFGEELMEHNAEAAMARTCRETAPRSLTIPPVPSMPPRATAADTAGSWSSPAARPTCRLSPTCSTETCKRKIPTIRPNAPAPFSSTLSSWCLSPPDTSPAGSPPTATASWADSAKSPASAPRPTAWPLSNRKPQPTDNQRGSPTGRPFSHSFLKRLSASS